MGHVVGSGWSVGFNCTSSRWSIENRFGQPGVQTSENVNGMRVPEDGHRTGRLDSQQSVHYMIFMPNASRARGSIDGTTWLARICIKFSIQEMADELWTVQCD